MRRVISAFLSISVSFGFASICFAGNKKTVCKNGELKRRVDLTYETQGEPVPCEVHYRKPVEAPGQDRVIFRAENEAGYCERKSEEFVNKLRNWGWTCDSTAEEKTAH